jgi:hypothetical protein
MKTFSILPAWFPLLFVSFLIYGVLVWLVIGPESMEMWLNYSIDLPLFSGDTWKLSWSHGLLLLSLVLLYFELMKSTNGAQNSVANHMFSIGVLVLCAIAFLMFPGFGTSTFFLIACMALLDVIAGFAITIVASRREIVNAPPVVNS